MPTERWEQLDRLVARMRPASPTEARAVGQAMMALMDTAEAHARAPHWLDWEREKTTRLLRDAGRAA
jgi:hypothetical protein